MRGFFAGRFQPFHKGHLRFVEEVSDDVDELIVGVGSAEASHTIRNPFTAGERISMIHRTTAQLDTTTFVIPIEDIDRNSVWVAHVVSLCPPFDVVYTNNPLVDRLFREAGFSVRGVDLIDRDRYQGTVIRERILDGDPWRDLVPDPVAAVIDDVDGVDRMRELDTDDT